MRILFFSLIVSLSLQTWADKGVFEAALKVLGEVSSGAESYATEIENRVSKGELDFKTYKMVFAFLSSRSRTFLSAQARHNFSRDVAMNIKRGRLIFQDYAFMIDEKIRRHEPQPHLSAMHELIH